jgi:hypothetical protein
LCETKPEITIVPSAVDFGDQRIDKTGQPREITVTNSGTGLLEIDGAAINGVNWDEFYIISDECSGQTVSANNSCLVQIIFAPTDTGPRRAALTINSNAASGVHSVLLEGKGIGIPVVNLNPESLEFTVEVDEQSVTVANTGAAPLKITDLTIAGSDPAYFYIDGENCTQSPLEPGRNCNISVRFTLTPGGHDELYRAELIIYDNALDSPQRVALRGTGVGAPIVEISPERLEFYANQTIKQTATIRNIGSAALEINDLVISGDDSDHFYLIEDNCNGRLIDPFQDCTLMVGFKNAKIEQVYEADLTIYDNADDSPQRLPLWGKGPPGADLF